MTRTRRPATPGAHVPLPAPVGEGETHPTPLPPVVLNPEAIGDPNQTPIVDLDPHGARVWRRASLRVQSARGAGNDYFVKLTASNGEPLGTGETHPTTDAADQSRRAWIRAMIDVIEDEGFTVLDENDPS